MTSPHDLTELKSRVSTAILKKVPGVTGVGLPAQGLTIYLTTDTAEVRAAVLKAIEPLKLDVPVSWQVSGEFRR